MSDEQILELSSLAPVREKARLRTKADPDGSIYEVASHKDFGPVSLRKIGKDFAEAEELWEKEGNLDKSEEKRWARLMDNVCSAIVPEAPKASLATLDPLTKRALAMRFFASAGEATASLLPRAVQQAAGLLPETTSEN